MIKGEAIFLSDLFYETLGGCTYWFTSALVVAQLIILLLLLTRKRSIWFYAIHAFLLSAFGWYLASINFHFVDGSGAFPWQYKQGLICMTYLAMGGLYWRYEARIRKILKWWILLPLVMIYFI